MNPLDNKIESLKSVIKVNMNKLQCEKLIEILKEKYNVFFLETSYNYILYSFQIYDYHITFGVHKNYNQFVLKNNYSEVKNLVFTKDFYKFIEILEKTLEYSNFLYTMNEE